MRLRSISLNPLAWIILTCLCQLRMAAAEDHLVFQDQAGPGNGKHVVFLAGDEEYRSEEALPMLAQIAAAYGFKCAVLFSMNERGFVDPDNQASLSHPEALDLADAIVMALRFRNWNDDAMSRFEAAVARGVPIIALRTSTHAFKFPKNSRWAKYSFRASEKTGWPGGFGKEILGETWVSHHGKHKVEGTRSVVAAGAADHPILNGVGEIFGATDVYEASPPNDSEVLLLGEVTESLRPDSPPVADKNDPMQPIAWTREYRNWTGATNRVFTTTMGAATDLTDEDLRRLVINAIFWGLELPAPGQVDVSLPGDYQPTPYGFNQYQRGQRPEDYVLRKKNTAANPLRIGADSRIALIGNGLGSRMSRFGFFEAGMHLRFPNGKLFIRNLCDEGNTPSFRPHSGRSSQLGFPGAEAFHEPYTGGNLAEGSGHFQTDEEWLTRLEIETVVALFGFNESFMGMEGLEHFQKELDAFVKHTLSKSYNGASRARLALVSPIAYEDRSDAMNVPDGKRANERLAAYAKVMREVAEKNETLFVDAFAASKDAYSKSDSPLTNDGAFLNEEGYRWFGDFLAEVLSGRRLDADEETYWNTVDAARDKNWIWRNDFKIPNGVHVYGQRYEPFGPANYPDELRKLREMAAIRDQAVWSAANGESIDVRALDEKTHVLPQVPTNYRLSRKNGALTPVDAEKTPEMMSVPDGYKVDLWASEDDFPFLANPVQLSFDNHGRLWVAVMPSYPHYRPGDPYPDDKLLILEDTDHDGRADTQPVWADGLHLPLGFELAPEGVYVSQDLGLLLLKDSNGDGKADTRERVLGGFDNHDSHHAIGAFTADPSGALMLCEGLFLRSNIETVRGPVLGSNGGFYRFSPQRRQLERIAQLRIPNPWGIAVDEWGQAFFLHTSNPAVEWLLPGSIKPRYGESTPRSVNLIEPEHQVRPTSGLEFLYSRHFPDEVQGDMLLCNSIGFRGIKQHQVMNDDAGYDTRHRQDLLSSEDGNFRPVDLEVAPDGSLFVVDWHNPLIGHMQHNARDPNRDHAHGRIYRITYPSRPLLEPAEIADASHETLFENLKLPEYRSRYRTRRELRGRDPETVLPALARWIRKLDQNDENHERLLLEALWVTSGFDRIDESLLKRLLRAEDFRVRAGAVEALRNSRHRIPDTKDLLSRAVEDSRPRVRLAAIAAASWLESSEGLAILDRAEVRADLDNRWLGNSLGVALAHLKGERYRGDADNRLENPLEGELGKSFERGYEVYHREAHCVTCHQKDGNGLPASGFPPLRESDWVSGDEERLIKLTLHGLYGPFEMNGRTYEGQVPMTPFGGLLDDEEIADVLTFVRNSFGNQADPIAPETVSRIREETKDQEGFYRADDLLRE